MLQIALPNKGALSEEAIALVKEAGYRIRRDGRELTVVDEANEVEFYFLRPRDIAVYVDTGVLDIGITGRDLAVDSETDVVELLALGFGGSTFRYAVQADSQVLPEQFGGMRIATSYPNIVKADMAARGVDVLIVRLDGAVEISIQLGVADAIADVVESGQTLRQAGLKTVGEAILRSEAVVIARDSDTAQRDNVRTFIKRLEGIVVARDYVMVEYDVESRILEEACRITPGIESPTVAPLSKDGWVAVKAMSRRGEVNHILDELQVLGATGILVSDIRTCRI